MPVRDLNCRLRLFGCDPDVLSVWRAGGTARHVGRHLRGTPADGRGDRASGDDWRYGLGWKTVSKTSAPAGHRRPLGGNPASCRAAARNHWRRRWPVTTNAT